MSIVTYGGVQLPYANTTQFTQKAVYEESNTDRVLTQFDVTVQCLISSAYAAMINTTLVKSTQNPADFMAWVRQRLLAQRKTLSVVVNGVELIPQPQTGNTGTVDAKNGPQPQFCNIVQLTDTLFIVNYRVLAHYWENNNGDTPKVPVTDTNNPGGNILYNRWSETVSIDINNYTTRTRKGKFAIRSDNVSGFVADQLRAQMAVVGVPVGFLRTKNEYKVDPDGLIMEYEQVDAEQYKMPPNPAFEASGKITLTTDKGAKWTANTHVELKGDAQTNQITLVEAAVFIATVKVENLCNVPVPPADYFIMKAEVSLDLWKNEVTADFSWLISKGPYRIKTTKPPGRGRVPPKQNFLDAFIGLDDSTPITDDGGNTKPLYLVYGTSNLLLRAAAYYDPSVTDAQLVSPPAGGNLVNQALTPDQPGNSPAQLSVNNNPLPQPGQVGKTGE